MTRGPGLRVQRLAQTTNPELNERPALSPGPRLPHDTIRTGSPKSTRCHCTTSKHCARLLFRILECSCAETPDCPLIEGYSGVTLGWLWNRFTAGLVPCRLDYIMEADLWDFKASFGIPSFPDALFKPALSTAPLTSSRATPPLRSHRYLIKIPLEFYLTQFLSYFPELFWGCRFIIDLAVMPNLYSTVWCVT